jgi:hypothetical protein
LIPFISKLELGQQIIYIDLKDEFDELGELTKVLNKKNWLQQLQGKLISIGLGKLSEERVAIIEKTLGGNQLIQ